MDRAHTFKRHDEDSPQCGKRLRKVLSILLALVFACVLLCVIAFQTMNALGVKFPEWMRIGAERSFLEGRYYEEAPELSIESIENGNFQNSAEKWLADRFPAKDQVLLANAAMQRRSIKAASELFGLDLYPSFYGSNKVIDALDGSIESIPVTQRASNYEEALKGFARGLSSVAKAFPEKRFVVFVADVSGLSASNPLHGLVSSYFTTEDAVNVLEDCLSEVSNVSLLTDATSDSETFASTHYKGDHHWNGQGMMDAMNSISSELGLIDLPAAEVFEVEGPYYIGSDSRNALIDVTDIPEDVSWDLQGIVNVDEDGSHQYADHEMYYSVDDYIKQYAFYGLYFPNSTLLEGSGSGNALIVCDSFGYALQGPLAASYENLVLMNDLHNSSFSDRSLVEKIEEADAEDVCFIGAVNNYAAFLERHPNFFSLNS